MNALLVHLLCPGCGCGLVVTYATAFSLKRGVGVPEGLRCANIQHCHNARSGVVYEIPTIELRPKAEAPAKAGV